MDIPHTVELIFRAVNVMLPVVTGYLVLFVGAIGKLWQLSEEYNLIIRWNMANFTIITGIFSLGCFAGAMAFGIIFSTGENSKPWWLCRKHITPKKALSFSRQFLSFGYSIFILSVILGILTCKLTIGV
jgi:hypothetical protein